MNKLGHYFIGVLTSTLILAPFLWATPNVGWSKIDTEGVKIKYAFEKRELVKIRIAVPIGVEVEYFEVVYPEEKQNEDG